MLEHNRLGYQYSDKNKALAAAQCIVKGIPCTRIGTARMWHEVGRTPRNGESPLTLYQPIVFADKASGEEITRIIPRAVWYAEAQTRPLEPGEIAIMPQTTHKTTKPKPVRVQAVKSSSPKPVKAARKTTAPKRTITIVKDIEPVETTYTRPVDTIIMSDHALATVNRKELVNALKQLRRTAQSKVPIPVLSNVLINVHATTVELMTTDMQAVQVAYVDASGTEPGALTTNCKALLDFLNQLKEQSVELNYKESKLHVTCGIAKMVLETMPEDEYPIMPNLPRKATHRTDAAAFITAINQVIPGAASDDARPVLAGLLIDIQQGKCSIVAADGFRLHMVKDVPITGPDAKYIIPAATLKLLPKATGKIEITAALEQNQLRFTFPNLDITTRLIADCFPNYNQIIPTNSNHVIEFPCAELLTALKSAKPLVKESDNKILLRVENGELLARGNGGEQGYVTVYNQSCDWPEDTKIAFNINYMIDVLLACGSPTITMSIQSASSPGLFGTGNFTAVIMPMHLAGGR